MECKGYNGSIAADDQCIVVVHSGLVAKAGGLVRDTPRRIPLRALSDVRIKQATRLVNGHLTIAVGGDPVVDVGSQAASSADTVIFTHKDNAAFQGLHDWLRSVVEHNRDSGVDQSEFASIRLSEVALETDLSNPESSAKAASRPSPKAHETREQKQHTKMTNLLGNERPDIVAAAARMEWRAGGKRELRKLAGHLHRGENVRLIAQGTYDGHQGILVLTDVRLLFLFHGVVGQSKEDFPLHLISSVRTKSGFGTGEITIYVSGNTALIQGVIKTDLERIADAIREGIAAQHASVGTESQPVQLANSASDAAASLLKIAELHFAGILTDEEFAEKKAELLGRL